jgi:hypothetical protein
MRKEKIYGTLYGESYELEPINVKRFIWHVTPKKNRANIFLNGLLPSENNNVNRPLPDKHRPNKGLLFANNLNHDLMNMWPVRFQYDQGFGFYEYGWKTVLMMVNHTMGCGFDFWRIDTKKTDAQWFVDPILAGEWWGWGLDSKYHYVCTPDRIGVEALALFEFEPEYAGKSFIKRGDGVAHISYNHLPLKRVA